jgi:hypothetical protein
MTTRSKVKRFYVREFLNLPGQETTAAIHCDMNAGDRSTYLAISDCSRKVELQFSMWDKTARKNALYKARLLADTLNEFVKVLEARCRELETQARKRKKP